MTYTLSYRSSRREVWRWYWRSWRARLWKIHVLMATMIACLYTMGNRGSIDPLWLLSAFLVILPTLVALLALAPQVMFKSQQRTLSVGPGGWSTRIGRQSGSRTWDQIEDIQDSGDTVALVGDNGNALIIPRRAFADSDQRDGFIRDINTWHRAARP